MYYQTVHHKKIVNGMTVRGYRNIRDFIDNTAVMRLLAYPEQSYKDTSVMDVTPLKKHKIKYVVLHRNYLTEKEVRILTSFLEDKFEKVFNDREIVAYQMYH